MTQPANTSPCEERGEVCAQRWVRGSLGGPLCSRRPLTPTLSPLRRERETSP